MALLWAHLLGEEPQWSPPLNGGSTAVNLPAARTTCCRNGARR